MLDSYPIVPMTPSISRRAGRLLGRRLTDATAGDGPGIGKGDAVVAATALERDELVLTGDTHFETISDIDVETYR